MSQQRVGSLEITQDMTFQRRAWVVQRVAWAVMLLTMVAAVLGLFATGPLSSTSAATDDGVLNIEYGRFARHDAQTDIQIVVSPEAVQAGEIQVRADQAFLDTYQIESITPEPDSIAVESDGITWTFTAGELTEPGQINLQVRPDSVGIQRGRIGLAGGEMLTLRQLVYP